MQKPLVGVLIASRTDFNVMRRGLETLRVLGVPYVFDVISPHRTPEKLEEFARTAGERGIEVLIAAAGGSAYLPVHVAAFTTLPIIGVPIDASPLRGQDALFSLAMVPPGLPIATVGINGAENAALLAAQILALRHPRLREVLAHRRMSAAQRTDAMLKELVGEYPDLCLTERTAPLVRPASDSSDTEDYSEAITPEPPEEPVRIQPGATYVERSSGPNAQALVSTPVPHEPGAAQGTVRWASPSSSANAMPFAAAPQQPMAPGSLLVPAAEQAAPGDGDAAMPAAEDDDDAHRAIHTKVFRVDRGDISDDLIDHVMMVLLEGGVVGIPTDTVYGLAADATNKVAVERLLRVKGREHQKTLGVLIHHPDMLSQLVREVPPQLERVIEECWPGALTIILPKQSGVLPGVARSNRLGIRMPADPVCLAVISRISRPIVMRNASVDPAEPMTRAEQLIEHYTGEVDCIVDAGECPASDGASTVLSADGEQFEILREGGVSRERLKALLGDKLK